MNTVMGLFCAGMECGGLGQAAAEIKASCIILLACTILECGGSCYVREDLFEDWPAQVC